MPKALRAHTDADWAGCPVTRKSTSCCNLMLGQHLLVVSSTTQIPISLSVGEAEFYATTKGGSRLMGGIALLKDMGVTLLGELATDSAAAKGILCRRGAGKVRHIETPALWTQKAVHEKRFTVLKIDGKMNPSDIGTKFLDAKALMHCLELSGCEIRAGRPNAPQMMKT